jgi:hypothetical protein
VFLQLGEALAKHFATVHTIAKKKLEEGYLHINQLPQKSKSGNCTKLLRQIRAARKAVLDTMDGLPWMAAVLLLVAINITLGWIDVGLSCLTTKQLILFCQLLQSQLRSIPLHRNCSR